MIVFDDMFYRIAKFFCKRDGMDAFGSIVILSIIQSLLLAEVLMFVFRIIWSTREIAAVQLPVPAKVIGILVGILFMYLNYKRYRKTYWRFSDRWRNKESFHQTTLRGFLVLLGVLLPFIILILIGTIFGLK